MRPKKRSLMDFLRAIKVEENSSFQIDKLDSQSLLLKPLTTMADTLTLRGDYRKAISIYLYLIENLKSFYEQEPMVVKLGDSYLKAGFFDQKAEEYHISEDFRKHSKENFEGSLFNPRKFPVLLEGLFLKLEPF